MFGLFYNAIENNKLFTCM